MAQIINSNIASLNAQRNLNSSQGALSISLQRLSSGLRINSAKDDAAGMAISERMTAQIRGLNQAVRNASDGIALAQTAESAMGSVSGILQRIRELAIQSANDTNSTTDRASLNTEVIQLQQELDRIATSTEFNGQRIIDGSFSGATFQVGANSNQTITFGISSVRSSSIGGIAEGTGTAVTSATATDITVAIGGGSATSIASSANFATSTNGQNSSSAYAKAAAINDAGIASLSATASTSVVSTVAAIGGTAADTYTLVINGVTVYSGVDVATALTNSALRDQINTVSDQTGVIASLSGGDMTLTAADGRNITVTESGTGFVVDTDGLAGDADITSGTAIRGTLTLSATDTIALGGTIAVIGFTGDIALDTDGIDDIDVETVAAAQTAIKRVDAALDVVNTNRSSLGAIQNRFESTIASLQSASENLSAARSGIRDTDFAAETANLTRNQILQQAGIAILAQANALPNTVLSLLQ